MDTIELGSLRVRRVVATAGKPATSGPPLTVVLMHGYGAPGDDLVALADVLAAPLGTTFLFPEAPVRLDAYGHARAWWDIDLARIQRAAMLGRLEGLVEEQPPGMPEATAQIAGALGVLERDFGTPSDRVVLGGFSQGSMAAVDVALRTNLPLAGLVLLSSALVAKPVWQPLMNARKDLEVFQSHGTNDVILPYAAAELLRDSLVAAGVRVQFVPFPGGHGIPPLVLHELAKWLCER